MLQTAKSFSYAIIFSLFMITSSFAQVHSDVLSAIDSSTIEAGITAIVGVMVVIIGFGLSIFVYKSFMGLVKRG